jgi:hypothetical protein
LFWFSFCVFTFASTCLVLFVDGFPSRFKYIYIHDSFYLVTIWLHHINDVLFTKITFRVTNWNSHSSSCLCPKMDSNWWIAMFGQLQWLVHMWHLECLIFTIYGLETGKINTKFGYNQYWYHFKYYHWSYSSHGTSNPIACTVASRLSMQLEPGRILRT